MSERATVSIVHASPVPPVVGTARLVTRQPDRVELELPEDGPFFPLQARLILEFPEGRAIGTVTQAEGRQLVVQTGQPRRELREYPRMHAGLNLRYQVLRATSGRAPDEASSELWLSGGELQNQDSTEYTPDPYMNFSATGVQFEDVPSCTDGDVLYISFQVPDRPSTYRAIGRVVRVSPVPASEQDGASHRIAVHFTHLPETAAVALRDYTLRLQGAFLDIDSFDLETALS